jgi:ParD-like antitoxin of type II bacterial toxin-antitoxin system
MAKSIRISDEFYDTALHAGEAMGRSLAQQLEHWARMGAALDAAGITFEQTVRLLQGPKGLHALLLLASGSEPDSAARTVAKIDQRSRELAAEVEAQRRSQESLFLFPTKTVRKARVVFAEETRRGAQGW